MTTRPFRLTAPEPLEQELHENVAAEEVVTPWLVAWFAWFPVVIDEPSLIALWLAIGWWFLPEDWWQ
jgi:hypothetical protein